MEPNSLSDWLAKTFSKYPNPPTKRSLHALANEAEHLVHRYMSSIPALRPSKITESLKGLAGHLHKAAKAAERLDEEGMMMILAASDANRAPETDWRQHIAYLHRMAVLTGKALQTSKEHTHSTRDDRGGRKADSRLQSLVLILALRYQELLALKPSCTINPETGYGDSDFMMFVKKALSLFHSTPIDGRAVDRAVQRAVPQSPCEFPADAPPPLFTSLSK